MSHDGSLKEGLKTQRRCLAALVVRDMMKRYGRANFGFLWVVLEPLLLTVGVMMIWSLVKAPNEHGIHIVTLVLTGYMPLTLWRHLSNGGIFLFRQSMGLLYHRRITLIDALFSRLILEFSGTTAALVLVYAVLAASGMMELPYDPGLALLGWLSMGLLGSSVAVHFAILTERSEVAERFIGPLQYLQLPISGCFFMVEWLPTSTQTIALFNPTVHCYEMFRAGVLGPDYPTHFSPAYPVLCSLVLFALGLSLLDSVRDHLNNG